MLLILETNYSGNSEVLISSSDILQSLLTPGNNKQLNTISDISYIYVVENVKEMLKFPEVGNVHDVYVNYPGDFQGFLHA